MDNDSVSAEILFVLPPDETRRIKLVVYLILVNLLSFRGYQLLMITDIHMR